MIDLNKDFWTSRYETANTGWDTGSITTPLKTYFNQLTDKSLTILIPGCGNGYEAEYLHQNGFDVTVVDLSSFPLKNLKKRAPSFKNNSLIQSDFFDFEGSFDLIIEQTFFSAIHPDLRKAYAEKMHSLLKPSGRLVGVLFNIELYKDHPPFGGNLEVYKPIFDPYFDFKVFETCYNSIEPRMGNELFINLIKK
jgi:methyl halide transferase